MRLVNVSMVGMSSVALAFGPTDPDIARCYEFYFPAEALSLNDCYTALGLLSKGSKIVPWYPKPGYSRNSLPSRFIMVGQYIFFLHSLMYKRF